MKIMVGCEILFFILCIKVFVKFCWNVVGVWLGINLEVKY